jgi:hypothetical protein
MVKVSDYAQWLDLLDKLEAHPLGGVDVRFAVSAIGAFTAENPEGARKIAETVRDKARSSRRGRGAPPKSPEDRRIVQIMEYRATHTAEETRAEFNLAERTYLEYERRYNKNSS